MVAPCGDVLYDARRDFAPLPTRCQREESGVDDYIRGRRRRSVDGGNETCEQSSVLTTASDSGRIGLDTLTGWPDGSSNCGWFSAHISLPYRGAQAQTRMRNRDRCAVCISSSILFWTRMGSKACGGGSVDGWLAAVSRQQEWLNNKPWTPILSGRSSRGCSAKSLAVGHQG